MAADRDLATAASDRVPVSRCDARPTGHHHQRPASPEELAKRRRAVSSAPPTEKRRWIPQARVGGGEARERAGGPRPDVACALSAIPVLAKKRSIEVSWR